MTPFLCQSWKETIYQIEMHSNNGERGEKKQEIAILAHILRWFRESRMDHRPRSFLWLWERDPQNGKEQGMHSDVHHDRHPLQPVF